MDAVLVYDDGPEAGLGHRRRIEAVADGLMRRGFSVQLQPSGEPVRGGVIVCDSHRTRADDQSLYRGDRIVAIDDLTRDLAVDLVVDPTPGATPEVHRRARCVMAGARFALVDPAICDAPIVSPRPFVERVLVATGAADRRGVGAAIASHVTRELRDTEVKLVVGPWGHASNDQQVHVVRAAEGLIAELNAADVVISAGGVTLLEALALGRPSVAIALKTNQRRAVTGVATAGAAHVADAHTAAVVAAKLAADHDTRTELFHVARRTIDALGAARVADEVARQMSLAV